MHLHITKLNLYFFKSLISLPIFYEFKSVNQIQSFIQFVMTNESMHLVIRWYGVDACRSRRDTDQGSAILNHRERLKEEYGCSVGKKLELFR